MIHVYVYLWVYVCHNNVSSTILNGEDGVPDSQCSAWQTLVTAYLERKQLLLFDFVIFSIIISDK